LAKLSFCGNLVDTKFQAVRRTPSPDNTRGITIAAAKFSSEDAAVLVQYTIAIVEYTRLCVPLKAALEKQHKLEREIEENERIAKEKANKVGGCSYQLGNNQLSLTQVI